MHPFHVGQHCLSCLSQSANVAIKTLKAWKNKPVLVFILFSPLIISNFRYQVLSGNGRGCFGLHIWVKSLYKYFTVKSEEHPPNIPKVQFNYKYSNV